MLEFATDVNGVSALGCGRGKSADAVEALLIGPPKVVRNRLAEVISVRQRLPTNSGYARIDGIDADPFTGGAGKNTKFG